MKKPNCSGGIKPPDITGTHPFVLHVSPELLGRMSACATADKFDLHEWVLRAVIGELINRQNENERKPHASHS